MLQYPTRYSRIRRSITEADSVVCFGGVEVDSLADFEGILQVVEFTPPVDAFEIFSSSTVVFVNPSVFELTSLKLGLDGVGDAKIRDQGGEVVWKAVPHKCHPSETAPEIIVFHPVSECDIVTNKKRFHRLTPTLEH